MKTFQGVKEGNVGNEDLESVISHEIVTLLASLANA